MIFVLIRYNSSDEDIYKFIESHFKYTKDTMNQKQYKLAQIANRINETLNISEDSVFKVLDVGCGNGNKTFQLGELLGKQYKMFGADIEEWGSYKKNRKLPIPFKQITMNPYRIPYPDRSMDIVFCSLTLHHCNDIIATILECKRLLSDNGHMVIIEHDVWTDDCQMLVDIQHHIYQVIFKESEASIIGTYFNFYEWDVLFNKCGLDIVYGDRLVESLDFVYRYDRQFIAIYKKT